MLQIKIVQGKSLDDLTNKVNELLVSIKTAKDITVDSTNLTAVIQHEIDEEWKNQIFLFPFLYYSAFIFDV